MTGLERVQPATGASTLYMEIAGCKRSAIANKINYFFEFNYIYKIIKNT